MEYGSNKPVKPPAQERYIEKIVIHERYAPGSEANDIALLKITPPVVCEHVIGPGCLPQFRAGPPRVPQTCWVAGWGFLKENGECGCGAPPVIPCGLCHARAVCGCLDEGLSGPVWCMRGWVLPLRLSQRVEQGRT